MPSSHFPNNNFLYEVRKCPRCRKEKQFLKSDTRKYCEECRAYAKNYKHQHRVFKLNKEDLAQMEEDRKRKNKELSIKYGTTEPDCLTWRDQYIKGQKSEFRYNHLQNCESCNRWYALHKNDPLDLNKGMEDVKDELKGYEEAFKTPKPDSEDYIYTPMGKYPMNRMCPICLSNLRPDGTCPVCEPD